MLRQASASPRSTAPFQDIHGSAELELVREAASSSTECVKPRGTRQEGPARNFDLCLRRPANRATGLSGCPPWSQCSDVPRFSIAETQRHRGCRLGGQTDTCRSGSACASASLETSNCATQADTRHRRESAFCRLALLLGPTALRAPRALKRYATHTLKAATARRLFGRGGSWLCRGIDEGQCKCSLQLITARKRSYEPN